MKTGRSARGFTNQEFHFGEFTLDLSGYRLQRGARALRMEKLPMELLILLVQRRGELVSRDEITAHLWEKDVFVDVDHGINTAVRKIRAVLGDDPEKPRFVETVIGKGYRFAAPVSCNGDCGITGQTLAQAALPPLPSPTVFSDASSPSECSSRPFAAKKPTSNRWQAWLVALVLVIAGGWYSWTRTRVHAQPATGNLMLAVLPFENLAGDATQDYFSDGLTEEMINQVGNLDPQHLGVIARTSVMYYKDRHEPLQQMGRELGVQYVLEGSVRREHEEARISIRLVRVADGKTLWTDSFDRHIGEVLQLQSEVAQRIGHELQMQVLGHANRKPTGSDVLEAYFRGRFELNRPEIQDAAETYFKRAIELDPAYAAPYAGLADFYRARAVRNDEGSEQAWRLAEQNATQALLLDSESAETHTAIAHIKLMHDWDWKAAHEHALRALQLNPSLSEAHTVYAQYLRIAGNIPEDLEQRKQALAFDPNRADLKEHLAFEHYFARDYQFVADSARQVLAANPNSLGAHVGLCICLGRLKAFDEAAAECGNALALEGHVDWAEAYRNEYRDHGYQAASLLVAKKQLDEIQKQPHPDLWDLANAYVSAGMPDDALRTLLQGVKSHEPGLLQIRVDPDFDPIRNDPRYAELLRQIGFPNK